MIHKEICSDCGGVGHDSDCKCTSGPEFVVGCCKRCGGEGMIIIKSEPTVDEIWLPPTYED